MKIIQWALLGLLIILPARGTAAELAFLVIDSNSYAAKQALRGLELPEEIRVEYFTPREIEAGGAAARFIDDASVIVVDVMEPELKNHLLKNVDISNKKIYALRGSRDDQLLKDRGFLFDPEIQAYYRHISVPNIRNMLARILHREIDADIQYQEVRKRPEKGIYHPDAERFFDDFGGYQHWHAERIRDSRNRPWLGLMIYSSSLTAGQRAGIDELIRHIEAQGWNVLACFGQDDRVLSSFFLDEHGGTRVDAVLAFSLKFYSAMDERVSKALSKLDVPILNAINIYGITLSEWRQDPVGLPAMHVVWTMANPEISGLIEPTVLTGPVVEKDPETGRDVTTYEVVWDNLTLLLNRLEKWVRLRQKPNEEKRVAIFYYNHSQGRQNVGASYLNVFSSLESILRRMRQDGYQVGGDAMPPREEIKALVLQYGRNIGSWSPGCLEKLLAKDNVLRLPVAEYKQWFAALPRDFREGVLEQWGPVEDSTIMIKDDHFIIPGFRLGNVFLLPEPVRGWGDDPMKLYHDTTLYPHHQYVAAYLWLKHGFRADAMIHLGTHATHEWLPGKQAGLSAACPPEVLITDIPNIYPYIVDNIGEGIQAKRRGRGVIIDHLTPPLRPGGLYAEYRRLDEMINDYEQAEAMDSETTPGILREIKQLSAELGLKGDMGLAAIGPDDLEELEHYLLELKENLVPYGLHSFGRSPQGEPLYETTRAISTVNPGLETAGIQKDLEASGPLELDRLMAGLAGEYIPSGEGNDPVRNPSAIPTGKNFYGFNPDRVPSPAAWELGRQAARQLIDAGIKEEGRYPEKVAVVLWATETIRNQGVNESTILHLLGLEPQWDRAGRVTGVKVIPGDRLGRPRLDVLINPSGLYRDLFPEKLHFLDRALEKASRQTDIENYLRKNNARLRVRLLEQGYDEREADQLSRIRIFSEQSGSYGTGVSEMTDASGLWESDDEISDVYEQRAGHAFGQGLWGRPAMDVFRLNLSSVDTAVHSRSSNLYGTLDNDDVFEYLGGLSMAVRRAAGRAPGTYITRQQTSGHVKVEQASRAIAREMRSRYLNPKWIQGMRQEDYAGAREMSNFVEYLWGWQVTVPDAVDESLWRQVYEVYVRDKYEQQLQEFFDQANPWAYQSITARMLEAVRKDYWEAEQTVREDIAAQYAINVVKQGVACCAHTCNNPLLNQMVVNIISMPGVLSPDIAQAFKLAVEQAAGRELSEQASDRRALQKTMQDSLRKSRAGERDPLETDSAAGEQAREVEGYKMEIIEDAEDDTSEFSASGVQWFASLFILMIVALFVWGVNSRRG